MNFLMKVAFVVVVTQTASVHAQQFELKGIQLGMTEAEFKKLQPSAICKKGHHDPKWDVSIPTSRTCELKKFTLANIEMLEASVTFFDDRLGRYYFKFYYSDESQIREALTEKYGYPKPFSQHGVFGVNWKVGSTEMTITKVLTGTYDSVFLQISSPASRKAEAQVAEFNRARKKPDL